MTNGNPVGAASGAGNEVACGEGAQAAGRDPIAIGTNAMPPAAAQSAVAIGTNALAEGQNAVASGTRAIDRPRQYCGGDRSIEHGLGGRSLTLGDGANATGASAAALGRTSRATAQNTTAIGVNASALTESAIAVGASVLGAGAIASGFRNTALGIGSVAAGNTTVAIGSNANTGALDQVSIGTNAGTGTNGNTGGIALGGNAGINVVGTENVAVGRNAGGNVLSNTNYAIGARSGRNVNGADNLATANGSGGDVEGNAAAEPVQNGDTVTVDAGSNIKLTQNGSTIAIAAKADVVFDSVTAGAGAGQVILNDGGISVGGKTYVDSNGLNANDQRITGVANGENDIDAANISQLRAVQALVDQGWTVTDAQGRQAKIGANGRVSFESADGNIEVAQTGIDQDGKVTVALNRNLALDSVALGGVALDAGGLSIAGGPGITSAGVDAGGKPIANVGAGVDPTDAVNLAQLEALGTAATTHYYRVNSSGPGNRDNDGASGVDAVAIGMDAVAAQRALPKRWPPPAVSSSVSLTPMPALPRRLCSVSARRGRSAPSSTSLPDASMPTAPMPSTAVSFTPPTKRWRQWTIASTI